MEANRQVNRQAGAARVFFALLPDDNCAESLQQVAARLANNFGGRAMEKSTLHLTLAFVGDVAEEKLAELRAVASWVKENVPPLESAFLTLNRLDYWRHNRILWAGTDRVAPALEILARQLIEHLMKKGYSLPARPFAAHVTLVRKVDRAPYPGSLLHEREAFPLLWRYRQFVLLRSHLSPTGAHYETLGAWELPDIEQNR